ncbi:RNA helicase [Stenotrophomonas acidaminiphila]|uniref:RNA helicase n=1 Tax=Stenotrophomonas acidaminiphila TaxID=128780 RepID=UPI0013759C32|nr:RNA helicase [Stenotrophomonas acidaminiphila]NCT88786.1 RNA helicase [Stenotrophomonas acidaminiphila]
MTTEPKTLRCGLVMPISTIDGLTESHWDEVRAIIKESLTDTGFSVELVSDSNEIGIIQKRIVQNLYDNDIVICDVSAKNPNVMFELGMRLAFDKPAIIIKDDKTNYSFDTSPIEHLQYPRDLHYHAIQAFKLKLRDKVHATYEASKSAEYTTFLKHFGQFVVAKLDEKPVGKDEYLLAAISELQHEVRSLAKASRSRESISSSTLSELSLRPPVEKRLRSEREFVFDRLMSVDDSSTLIQELSDQNSPEFILLLDEYLTHLPQNIASKNRNVAEIRKRLTEAVHLFKRATRG